MRNIIMTIAALFAVSVYAAPAPQTTTTPYPGECRAERGVCTFMFPQQCCEGLICSGASMTVSGKCVSKL
ncbi:unnamed protein product [Rhizoctonia solani]|uniref:Uncharacterized protein n=1 Tax=Rhizoctonia solani TaxID=456999 RepID=A0A8H3GUL2_9AGAM|nr:unnamed protein product [Rhizoctonia solani]